MDLSALILDAIKKRITTEHDLRQAKARFADGASRLVTNSELLAAYRTMLKAGAIKDHPKLRSLLTKRRVRSLSGVSVITVLTKPFGCPARCTYCPTEVNMPKSYLSDQPGAMRAVRNEFDPYLQVSERITSLIACGHPAEKIELIILGGTWSALPKRYQTWFVKQCLLALNAKCKMQNAKLTELQKLNESAEHRLVGFTIETRPDHIDAKEIKRLRELGVTRVELGAQSTYDDVMQATKRGHDTACTIRAVQLLKNAGMKVGLHVMPNLPKSNAKRDIAMFEDIFTSGEYMPDQLKVYPCMVLPNTPLATEYAQGTFKPYSDTVLATVVTRILELAPPWTRLSRIVRDIPSTHVIAGAKITNLRQILDERGIVSRDIRARELRDGVFDANQLKLITREYTANAGREVFLSWEDVKKDKIISFCRLRLPYGNVKTERATGLVGPVANESISGGELVRGGVALSHAIAFIREVHTYGIETAVGTTGKASQHKGFGKKLIAKAEKIAKEAGYTEIRIPAGCGVRPYYAKLGYGLKKTYMCKKLT